MLAAPPLWFSLLVGAVLRLVQVWMPIVGPHSWRQADTAAIARHFAEGGMQWWLPQIDWGGAGSGLVEAEFPLFPYGLALLYRCFGLHEWLGRLLSIACALASIWLVVRLGRRLLGDAPGRWGGLFFALSPLAIYYGRGVQAESLLLLLAVLCIERLLAWRDAKRPLDLLLSWVGFCGCALIKVLPLLWLGLAVAYWWTPQPSARRWLRDPLLWLYGLTAAGLTLLWYLHAHALGESSGLSFGFWAEDTNRYQWALLIGPRYWPELLLRLGLRGLALVGVPLLALGIWHTRSDSQARGLSVAAAAVLLAGALAPESSLVHEYYQLPVLLWCCPLMGAGISELPRSDLPRWISSSRSLTLGLLIVMALTTITILSLDYWLVERQQAKDLIPLAKQIQRTTTPEQRIVSVSGSDPTLLNLSRRRGWLTSPKKVNPERLRDWQRQGAVSIAGSFQRVESFNRVSSPEQLETLRHTLCWLEKRASQTAPSTCRFLADPYFVLNLQAATKTMPPPSLR